jgi:L-rhamnose isomerase
MPTFADIVPLLAEQAIELPSWAFGNSGTRFKVFAQPGVPRDPFEKIRMLPRCTSSRGLHHRWRCTSRGTR